MAEIEGETLDLIRAWAAEQQHART